MTTGGNGGNDHGPIEDQVHRMMNDIGNMLGDIFGEAGYGFALLAFKFNTTEGRMNYLSNAPREDMIKALREFLGNFEADAKK